MIDGNRSLLRFDSVRKCETLHCLDFVYYSNSDQCLGMIDFWTRERERETGASLSTAADWTVGVEFD